MEKLLVVDDQYMLKGLITVKDIQKKLKYPNAAKDAQGRLRVGAALGSSGDYLERAQELVKKKVDVLAVDSAHGHSQRVMEAIAPCKKRASRKCDLIAGNVATFEGARDLICAGRGRDQGRHRPGFHLHHARGQRRGRSADHRHRGVRRGRAQAAACR